MIFILLFLTFYSTSFGNTADQPRNGLVEGVVDNTSIDSIEDVDAQPGIVSVEDVEVQPRIGSVEDVEAPLKMGSAEDVDDRLEIGSAEGVEDQLKIGSVEDAESRTVGATKTLSFMHDHIDIFSEKQNELFQDTENSDLKNNIDQLSDQLRDRTLCPSSGELNPPPVAEEILREFQIHGQYIKDEYAWLRDENWPSVTNSKILDYLKAENEYAEQFFAPLNTESNVFTIYKNSMEDEIYPPDEIRDDWLYYRKNVKGKSYSVHCRKFKNERAPEEVILDVNKIAEGQKYTKVAKVSVSPDNNYVAYSVDHVGNEKYTIKIIDLNANSHLSDVIMDVNSDIVWHGKLLGFFYVPKKEYDREVFFHYIKNDVENDKLVHCCKPDFRIFLYKSSSDKYIFIEDNNWNKNEIYVLDITTNDEDFKEFVIREKCDGIHYAVTHAGDKFYVRTNLGAENYRVIAAPETEPSNWNQTYIPECEDFLQGIVATEKYILVGYKKDGLPIIKVKSFEDGEIKTVTFPDASYFAIGYTADYRSNDIRIFYKSLIKLDTTYKYDYDNDKLTVINSLPTIPSFNADDYVLEYIKIPSIKSQDEDEIVDIPVTICYDKSLFKGDGTNPLYLYGYGAYGVGSSPVYTCKTMSLILAGFVYVVAHVRGGDELGAEWHDSGKLLNKKRAFEDFVAVAEGLISRKYTNAGNIVASGESAGGTLVGAVINKRPELFKAVLLRMPFLDVLNTLLDESVPNTPFNFFEFGNPIEYVEYFEYIKSYSPYGNIKPQNYPSIFVTTAVPDMRVGYWEATKWVARLRKMKTDDNVVVLKISMDSGHLYLDSRIDYINEAAYELAFIYKIFGMEVHNNNTL